MSDTTQQNPIHEGKPSDEVNPQPSTEPQGKSKAFTQADLDDLAAKVRAEERRKASERYADYDDLKAKAGEKVTAEERIANLEKQLEQSNREALRRRVQAAHGIADEDADLFLTGTDEESLVAQAKRLAARESERKSNGNHVPTEGANPPPADDKDALARAFFGIS